jgi:hypothetical protein
MVELVQRQLARPADMTPPALRGPHPCPSPFPDQFALELRKSGEHGENQLSLML